MKRVDNNRIAAHKFYPRLLNGMQFSSFLNLRW
jgi:hypothetical protein